MAFKIDVYYEKKKDFVRFFNLRDLTGFPSNSFIFSLFCFILYLELIKNRARIKFVENILCSHRKLYSHFFESTYECGRRDQRLQPQVFYDKLLQIIKGKP